MVKIDRPTLVTQAEYLHPEALVEAQIGHGAAPIVRTGRDQYFGQAYLLGDQSAGQFLVGPDGTVTLGTYGNVRVVGMTLPQAKAAIEAYLSQYLEKPEISINVFAFNSNDRNLLLVFNLHVVCRKTRILTTRRD